MIGKLYKLQEYSLQVLFNDGVNNFAFVEGKLKKM